MQESQHKSRQKLIIVNALLLTATLIICEALFFVLERKFSIKKFDEYKRINYESFYYYHLKKAIAPQPPPGFNSLLGWCDFTESKEGKDYILTPVNPDRWRHAYRIRPQKDRTRVILVGDSLTYGWDVNPNETIDFYLAEYLGSEYEVINLASRGYGIDQMSILAIESAKKYSPDIIVFNFIVIVLDRCYGDFSDIARAKKPFFAVKNNRLILQGTPVPTPFETYLLHKKFINRMKDAFFTWSQRSRVFCLMAQSYLKAARDKYVRVASPLIIKHTQERIGNNAQVLFFVIKGKLPYDLEQEMHEQHIRLFSLEPLIGAISRKLDVEPDSHPDGHFKSGLNRISAYAIYKQIVSLRKISR